MDRKICRERYGLDLDRKVFFFVGRIDKEKRIDVILRALQRLERDDIQFCVAGHGAALGKLKRMAHELELGDLVRFTGFVPNEDLPCLINSLDAFVMPSEAELLSIASLEAMACGRPMLAANAVALPELVTDGMNGYLLSRATMRMRSVVWKSWQTSLNFGLKWAQSVWSGPSRTAWMRSWNVMKTFMRWFYQGKSLWRWISPGIARKRTKRVATYHLYKSTP